MQVALERIGPRGRLVGVDLVEPAPLPRAAVVVGDIRVPGVLAEAVTRLGDRATVVLSDAAPKLTGIVARDQSAVADLAEAVVDALPRILSPGGRLVLKIFSGSGYDTARRHLRGSFEQVHGTRPRTSRPGSAELYLVATGFRLPCG